MGFGVFLVHPTVVSVLLSASVERCFVSRRRDFFDGKGDIESPNSFYGRAEDSDDGERRHGVVCEHRAVTETKINGDQMHAFREEELASLVLAQGLKFHPAWKLVCQIAQSLGFHWFHRRLLDSILP